MYNIYFCKLFFPRFGHKKKLIIKDFYKPIIKLKYQLIKILRYLSKF